MMNVHIARWSDVQDLEADCNPDDRQYRYRILAEGDSWFSIGGFPGSNLLFPLRLPRPAILVSLAQPGDTIRRMSAIASNHRLRQALSASHGYRWHAILLSGGGNDLIDDVHRIIVRPRGRPEHPADYCDEAALLATLADVERGYRRLVRRRDRVDSSCRGKPILAHTYDFVTPRNAPARFLGLPAQGPWLYPALRKARIPRRLWNDISDYLLGRLAERIRGLARGPDRLPAFHVVNTLDTLVPAELGTTRESNDWMNEIHPNAEGYAKLAAKIGRRLARLLSR